MPSKKLLGRGPSAKWDDAFELRAEHKIASCAKPGGHVQSQEHDSNVMPLEQILAMLNHMCRARDKRGHDGEKHDSIPAEP